MKAVYIDSKLVFGMRELHANMAERLLPHRQPCTAEVEYRHQHNHLWNAGSDIKCTTPRWDTQEEESKTSKKWMDSTPWVSHQGGWYTWYHPGMQPMTLWNHTSLKEVILHSSLERDWYLLVECFMMYNQLSTHLVDKYKDFTAFQLLPFPWHIFT